MRILLSIAIAACGPSTPSPGGPEYPLPADNAGSASVARAAETSAECVPGGTYRVQWDFANAKITGAGGVDDESCTATAEGLATAALAEMKIRREGGFTILWPGQQNVLEKGPCAFDITSKSPAIAKITFSGGTGNGTASFSVEKNHPGERCDVENAVFLLAKQPES